MANISIELVKSKGELKNFIRFPNSLYADDPNYVPPLMMERLDSLQASKNPYFDHAEVALWVAKREGKIVGRISAQACELVKEYVAPDMGQFGMFECIDDAAVAAALFDTALNWLKERGKTRVQGPFNLSVNMETGALIDGFDTPPMIMMGHGRPYYLALYEGYGFTKAKDLLAFYKEVDQVQVPKAMKLYEMALKNKNLSLHHINMKNFKKELATYFDIFNDSWSNNWNYVPFTKAEGAHAAISMRPLIKPERAVWVEYKGQPAGFLIYLPNINEFIQDLNGAEGPIGMIKLGWRILTRKTKGCRVPLMGIRKEFQGKAIGAAMMSLMTQSCRNYAEAEGMTESEFSWILEDNKGMISLLKMVDSKPYKTYRVFERAID